MIRKSETITTVDGLYSPSYMPDAPRTADHFAHHGTISPHSLLRTAIADAGLFADAVKGFVEELSFKE